ncbi:hypothetical protein D3C81_1912530 [compost metagenome]
MSSNGFPLPLNVQYNNTAKTWKLLQPFIFVDEVEGPIDVPARFTTNGLTLPRVPLVLAMFDNYGFPAAVVHDYLYDASGVGRKEADQVFYRALRASGVARWRAGLMYAGVRLFGRFYYKER